MHVRYAKIAFSTDIMALASMIGGVSPTISTVYRADRHASANLVYHSQHGRLRWREQNRI